MAFSLLQLSSIVSPAGTLIFPKKVANKTTVYGSFQKEAMSGLIDPVPFLYILSLGIQLKGTV